MARLGSRLGGGGVSHPRKFDHDLARVMRFEGELSWQVIADELGVSKTAVMRVCDEAVAARMTARQREFQRSGICGDCGGPMSHNPCFDRRRIEAGLQPLRRCRECNAIHCSITKTKSARPEELLCTLCGEWKPDEAFPRGRIIGRRLRKTHCTPCDTAERRARRQALGPVEMEALRAYDRERQRVRRVA